MKESNPGRRGNNELSPQKKVLLQGFKAHHSPDEGIIGVADQSSAELKATLSWYDIDFSNETEMYGVMSGIDVATRRMEQLLEMGYPPKEVGKALRESFAAIDHVDLKED